METAIKANAAGNLKNIKCLMSALPFASFLRMRHAASRFTHPKAAQGALLNNNYPHPENIISNRPHALLMRVVIYGLITVKYLIVH
ncbi:hypothetical protein [Dryocola sp. BD613]|uniref:hypothetical protein n=1 Tax=Dryocola sp. BD613 TaxID=3133272 RepID=UPI003F4FE960